jgi:hypothetical protein
VGKVALWKGDGSSAPPTFAGSSTAILSASKAKVGPTSAVCDRILNRTESVQLTFVVFDVLALEGDETVARLRATAQGCQESRGTAAARLTPPQSSPLIPTRTSSGRDKRRRSPPRRPQQ